jgi:hypothetical protein
MACIIKHRVYYTVLLLLFCWCNGLPAQITDYANIDNWAAHKDKWDMADSIPKPLRKQKGEEKTVNIFFIHPTTYTDKDAYKQSWNASVADATLNNKTDNSTILFQASCFNAHGYVYAPRYRQAHIQAFFSSSAAAKAALDTAYTDVKAAFTYFIENLNNDYPIVMAAHSQGTVHAGRLIKEFFEGKPLMQKLIVAYLIGMPVKKNYFTSCQPCRQAKQINCFASWRSFLKGNEEGYLKYEAPNSVYVTNPLNWSLDTTVVSRKQNAGAVLLKFNKLFKKVSAAQVHNNILWISKPKFPFSFLVKNKLTNYHIADINLFYKNIRENLKQRVSAYMQAGALPE